MILTGHEIAREVKSGHITISPFDRHQLNPNSYNYRLSDEVLPLPDTLIEPSRAPAALDATSIPPEGLLLLPGHLYLAHTLELIGSEHYVPSLIGRSTMGRLGLWLQVTSDLGHLGTCHHWTLELNVVQPLRVYAGMRIGQVTFWVPRGSRELSYEGAYADDDSAALSSIYREFANQ